MKYIIIIFILGFNLCFSQSDSLAGKRNKSNPDYQKEKYSALQLIASISIGNFYSGLMSLNSYFNEIDTKCTNQMIKGQIQTVRDAYNLMKQDYVKFKKEVTLGEKDLEFVNKMIMMCESIFKASESLIVYEIRRDETEKKNFISQYKASLDLLQNITSAGGK